MQGCDYIELLRQGLAVRRFRHAGVEEMHAIETQALRQRLRSRYQFAARLYSVNLTLAQRLEKQVIQNKT